MIIIQVNLIAVNYTPMSGFGSMLKDMVSNWVMTCLCYSLTQGSYSGWHRNR